MWEIRHKTEEKAGKYKPLVGFDIAARVAALAEAGATGGSGSCEWRRPVFCEKETAVVS